MLDGNSFERLLAKRCMIDSNLRTLLIPSRPLRSLFHRFTAE
jgi:hypothetical protein